MWTRVTEISQNGFFTQNYKYFIIIYCNELFFKVKKISLNFFWITEIFRKKILFLNWGIGSSGVDIFEKIRKNCNTKTNLQFQVQKAEELKRLDDFGSYIHNSSYKSLHSTNRFLKIKNTTKKLLCEMKMFVPKISFDKFLVAQMNCWTLSKQMLYGLRSC